MMTTPGFSREELEAERAKNGAALALREETYDGLQMAVAPAEAHRRLQELRAFVQSTMVLDEDFGTIPGTQKPTLYQSGAQKLAEIYGFSHRFEWVESVKDWERGFFYFEVRCILSSRRDGRFVGEGIGSCNSRESKYAGRWVGAGDVPSGMDKGALQKRVGQRWVFASEVPPDADKSKLQKRERTSNKTGKPYTQFSLVDEQYLIPNPDPYSLVNTLQKMAAKRAYVMAVIAATRSAGIFTQDAEDLPPEVFGKAEKARTWEEGEFEPDSPPATAATEDQRAKAFTRVMDGIRTAETLDELRKAVSGKLGLTEAQTAAVAKMKDQRKAEIVARQRGEAQPPAEAPATGSEEWDEGRM